MIKMLKNLFKMKSNKMANLMKRPAEHDLSQCAISTDFGKNLHTHKIPGLMCDDEETWMYPNGIEKYIYNDVKYKVWFKCKFSSDTFDKSRTIYVHYIEPLS